MEDKHIDTALRRQEEIEIGKIKPVPLIDLLLQLLEDMDDAELEELYKDLKADK